MAGFEDPLLRLVTADASRIQRARAAAEWIRQAGFYRWVGIYDVTPEEIVAIAWSGNEAPAFARFPRSQGLSGAAVASGHPVVAQDVSGDSRYLPAFGSTQSEAIFPIRVGTSPVTGTLDVESDRRHAFTRDDQAFLLGCAASLAALWMDPPSARLPGGAPT